MSSPTCADWSERTNQLTITLLSPFAVKKVEYCNNEEMSSPTCADWSERTNQLTITLLSPFAVKKVEYCNNGSGFPPTLLATGTSLWRSLSQHSVDGV